MSVILDALRRSRKGQAAGSAPRSEPSAPATRPLPAGLGLGRTDADVAAPASRTKSVVRPARTRLLGLAALLVVGLGIWAAIQVVRLLVSNYAPPTQSAQPTPTAIGQPSRPTPPPSGAAASTTRATDPAAPVNAPRAAGAPRTPRLPAQGLGSSPDADVNHFELALRYHNLGNYDEALKHYQAVLARDEFNVEARNNLGLLYHGRAMTREAIDQFRRAIAIHPQYVRARSNLAVVLTDAGRLAEARAELRAAMAMEPRNVDLLVNMALVEKADGHRDQAVELLVKAIGLQPTHGIAHYNAAVLYEERGSLALAYDHYEAFLKYGGPEHGLLLSSVQRRLVDLKPRLQTSR